VRPVLAVLLRRERFEPVKVAAIGDFHGRHQAFLRRRGVSSTSTFFALRPLPATGRSRFAWRRSDGFAFFAFAAVFPQCLALRPGCALARP
jgi:hypothetical protein